MKREGGTVTYERVNIDVHFKITGKADSEVISLKGLGTLQISRIAGAKKRGEEERTEREKRGWRKSKEGRVKDVAERGWWAYQSSVGESKRKTPIPTPSLRKRRVILAKTTLAIAVFGAHAGTAYSIIVDKVRRRREKLVSEGERGQKRRQSFRLLMSYREKGERGGDGRRE